MNSKIKPCGYDDKNYSYLPTVNGTGSSNFSTIKILVRYDVTVKNSKGKTIKTANNLKYGSKIVLNAPKAKDTYSVTVKTYFSGYSKNIQINFAKSRSHNSAAHYAMWNMSYIYG